MSLPFECGPGTAAPAQPGSEAPAPRSGAVVFVRHPRAKRYILRVAVDGTVRVTIPRRGSKREAAAFVEQQRPWIESQQRRIARNRELEPPVDRDVERGLVERAKRDLPPRLFALAAAHGLTVRRVAIRNQRARWGSCSRNGHIHLNWRLVQMPAAVRDYVMIHELMHLKRMDHSLAFWMLVAQACPEYRAARRYLRAFARNPEPDGASQ